MLKENGLKNAFLCRQNKSVIAERAVRKSKESI